MAVHSMPIDILDDLCSRFIINVPEEGRKDLVRICFQVELAHWFYLDEYVNEAQNAQGRNVQPKLRQCSMREFAEHIFRHVYFLKCHADFIDAVLQRWKEYKLSVPTYGAVIINEDLSHVLLVQGYWSKSSWGFPKGKVNEDEQPHDCAVREVFEETGFDIGPYIDPEQYLASVINDQMVWLFLIPGVPTATHFQPRTKYEIRDVRWFPIADLPESKAAAAAAAATPGKPTSGKPTSGRNNFYMVIPFVRKLRKWVAGHKKGYYRLQPSHSQQAIMPPTNMGKTAAASTTPKGKKKSKDMTTPVPTSASVSAGKQNNPTAPISTSLDNSSPKAWATFRFKKKDILSAIATTPGWIQ